MRRHATILLLATMLGTSSAQAGPVLSGSFSSVVSSGSFSNGPNPPVNVVGTTVTGTFSLSSLAGASPIPAFSPGAYLLQPGAVDLSFDILALGEMVNMTSATENSLVELGDNGTTQSVLLGPAFIDPHMITSLYLTGPEGSLFTSINDLASLHAGAGVSIGSPIFLSVYQQGSASLNITGETIGHPVNEPPSWAMLGLPLLGLAAFRRAYKARRNAA